MSARAVTCAHNQRQQHYTNIKHLLQRSIAHKINVEILEEKYKKISVLLQQLTYEIRLPTRTYEICFGSCSLLSLKYNSRT